MPMTVRRILTAVVFIVFAAKASAEDIQTIESLLRGDGTDVVLAGAAKVEITPDVENTEVWLAGYGNNRKAERVADPTWIRTFVIDVNDVRVSMSVIDCVGYGYDEVRAIRTEVMEKLNLSHVTICSTHTHSGPDTIGIWGPTFGLVPYRSGFDEGYRSFVREKAVESITKAVENLQPATIRAWQKKTGAEGFVRDSRRPHVIDDAMSVLSVTNPESNATIATIVNWSNHPETLPGESKLLSSDYPHFLREAIETGLSRTNPERYPNSTAEDFDGVGGVCLYFTGSVGGLMTPLDIPVTDPVTGTVIRENNYDKTRVLGQNLAEFAFRMMRDEEPQYVTPQLIVRTKQIVVPVTNTTFIIAARLGFLRREGGDPTKMTTEVGLIRIGEVSFMNIPGEIYPEIVIGGVENPEGADFPHEPEESPSLKELCPGRILMVNGLANDEIGYLIPHSEWDETAPNLYGANGSPYGEENSVGPEAGRTIYHSMAELFGASEGRPEEPADNGGEDF
ncbi:MAG: neutral/alkaline non-lysosomal ceramidase N-terminal domain-containing protein [Planctomycetes bacterium]|nr:neutral/alkaline non-lysosomal ceramidase N-terminal domain-containing protein [Planctomycetota bacterium]